MFIPILKAVASGAAVVEGLSIVAKGVEAVSGIPFHSGPASVVAGFVESLTPQTSAPSYDAPVVAGNNILATLKYKNESQAQRNADIANHNAKIAHARAKKLEAAQKALKHTKALAKKYKHSSSKFHRAAQRATALGNHRQAVIEKNRARASSRYQRLANQLAQQTTQTSDPDQQLMLSQQALAMQQAADTPMTDAQQILANPSLPPNVKSMIAYIVDSINREQDPDYSQLTGILQGQQQMAFDPNNPMDPNNPYGQAYQGAPITSYADPSQQYGAPMDPSAQYGGMDDMTSFIQSQAAADPTYGSYDDDDMPQDGDPSDPFGSMGYGMDGGFVAGHDHGHGHAHPPVAGGPPGRPQVAGGACCASCAKKGPGVTCKTGNCGVPVAGAQGIIDRATPITQNRQDAEVAGIEAFFVASGVDRLRIRDYEDGQAIDPTCPTGTCWNVQRR